MYMSARVAAVSRGRWNGVRRGFHRVAAPHCAATYKASIIVMVSAVESHR